MGGLTTLWRWLPRDAEALSPVPVDEWLVVGEVMRVCREDEESLPVSLPVPAPGTLVEVDARRFLFDATARLAVSGCVGLVLVLALTLLTASGPVER